MAMVESRTDAHFGDGFTQGLLARGTWISTSEPGCRAVLLVQTLEGADKALDFGDALCRAFYVDGRPTDDVDSLRRIAAETHVDGRRLLDAWSAPGAEDQTRAAFSKARVDGVASYPSMFLDQGRGLELVVPGCVPANEALALIERSLST
jgi:protein-disulfide isomerase-like protein with CxxC motif